MDTVKGNGRSAYGTPRVGPDPWRQLAGVATYVPYSKTD
jgi:hypothetical protein